jgi:hypothetical protein
MKHFDKKGSQQMFGILAVIIISFVVVFIAIRIFFPAAFGIQGDLSEQFSGIKTDSDGDAFYDFQDECPCEYGDLDNKGCPVGFSELDKAADQEKYHLDTKCGELESDTSAVDGNEFIGGFESYRSIEIFGDDDNGEVLGAGSGKITQACNGMVGRECSSVDNDCDIDEFSYPENTNYCLIMASEDDGWSNPHDCGQVDVIEGATISISSANSIKEYVVSNSYISLDSESDPWNLFSWRWQSKSEYGSLICNSGFWYGCTEGQEERELKVDGKNYVCENNEWIAK